MLLIWKHAFLRDKRLVFKNLNEINCILIDNLKVLYNAKFFLLLLILALIVGTTTYCLSFLLIVSCMLVLFSFKEVKFFKDRVCVPSL